MKTQTFIKEVEQLGFYTLTDGKDIYIFDREISEEELYYEDDTYAIATIGTDEYRDFVIEGKCIDKDTDVTKIYSLFKLIMEYTNTPVEDRKEHLNKVDILLLISNIFDDLSNLTHEDCDDSVKMVEDITYKLNVISEQFREYYFTLEELREIDKENEQRRDFMKINF